MRTPIIAPSIIAADFTKLSEEVEMVNQSQADWLHVDVMDGRFVPNITFGMMLVDAFYRMSKKPLDVHLMILEPEKYIDAFRTAGAHMITVHYEACTHIHRVLHMIKETGAKAGIAINPGTPVHLLRDLMHEVDLICCMSVNPGFGGQKFIPRSLKKIQQLAHLREEENARCLIEVDGGVTMQNAEAILRAGADVLVAGNCVFSAQDPFLIIQGLKSMSPDVHLV